MGTELVTISVPYRGATFLNQYRKSYQGLLQNFRPLSGSYISQFFATVLGTISFMISVPYRGATFLNSFINTYDFCFLISVPYRGATFLNTIPATPCPVWDE